MTDPVFFKKKNNNVKLETILEFLLFIVGWKADIEWTVQL